MKASEALIAWTPPAWAADAHPSLRWQSTSGQVKIGPLLSEDDYRDWTDAYAMTGGAAYTRTRKLEGAEAVAMVFIEFQTMVVGDQIDPRVAHEAFLVIDEYRRSISSDMPGAENIEGDINHSKW